MSDTKQLKPGTDGVPVIVYGQISDSDYLAGIQTSEGYRVIAIAIEEIVKHSLGGRTIGGPASNDITDNSSEQTMRLKTLIDPVIQVTPPGGGSVETIDEDAIYKLNTLIQALTTGGVDDGAKLVETTDNIPRQTFCALTAKQSGLDNTIALTAANLMDYCGIDDTGRQIDVRSLAISVWTVSGTTYTQKFDWTSVATVTTGTTALDTLTMTMHDASTMYSIGVHFRLIEA